jgi:hypothetical protein
MDSMDALKMPDQTNQIEDGFLKISIFSLSISYKGKVWTEVAD